MTTPTQIHTHTYTNEEPLKVKRNNDNLILESDCHRKKDIILWKSVLWYDLRLTPPPQLPSTFTDSISSPAGVAFLLDFLSLRRRRRGRRDIYQRPKHTTQQQ